MSMKNRKLRGIWLASDGAIISEVYESQEFENEGNFKGVVYEVFDGRENSVEIMHSEREAVRRHFAIGLGNNNGQLVIERR